VTLAAVQLPFVTGEVPELVLLLLAIVIAIVVVFVAIRVLDLDVDVGRDPARFRASRRSPPVTPSTEHVQGLRLILDQYREVAAALEAVINAPPGSVEMAAREWFSVLATRLAHLLREQRDHHYRVAIWLDDPSSPDAFIAVGFGMFDHHDENMGTLERGKFTIGGLAFQSPNGIYYCRDTQIDPNFHPRRTVPPSFHSVFGLALGRLNYPWGVMTVDARQPNGFPDDAQWLIRRFGDLASLGAVTWASKIGSPPTVQS